MTIFEYLFSFKGRIGRSKYWAFIVPSVFIFVFIPQIFSGNDPFTQTIILIFLLLLFMWPSIAIQVKRWHDINKSGYWVFINFIPVVGGIWAFLELGFLAGTPSANSYGAPPSVSQDKSHSLAPLNESDRKAKAWLGLCVGISIVALGNWALWDSRFGDLSSSDSGVLAFISDIFLLVAIWMLRVKIGALIHYLIRKV